MKNYPRYVRPVATIISLALFARLVQRTGLETVLCNIRQLGWSVVLVILLSGIRHMLRAQAWSWCVQTNGVRPPALQLLGPRLMGEALNDLTPAGPLIGEPAKILAVSKWIPAEDAASSVVVENLIYVLGAMLFMLSGIVLALGKLAAFRGLLWIGGGLLICFLVPIALLFWAVDRRTLLLGSMLDYLERRGLRWSFLDRHSPSLRLIESTVYDFFRDRRRTLVAVLTAEIATNFTGVAEAYLILTLTAAHSSVLAAYLVESASRAVQLAFSFVPLGLGVQEGATAATLQAFGYAASEGVSLAIIRKIRSLFWAALGLWFMAKHSAVLPLGEKSAVEGREISQSAPVLAISHQKRTGAERYEVRRLAS
jgi:uncharacterized protein (TIRG00374 family)